MAIHQDQKSQGKEVIDQYIKAIDLCLKEKIGDNRNCLGYPAASLIFNIVDALSSYTKSHPENGCCFDILKTTGFDLNDNHIKQLKKWYRHKLSHAGSMVPGVTLSVENTNIFSFNQEDEIIDINIKKLFDCLKKEWDKIQPVFDPTEQTKNIGKPGKQPFNNPSSNSPLLSTSHTSPTSGAGSPPVSGVA